MVASPRAVACEIVAGRRAVLQDAVLFWISQALALRLPDVVQAGWLAVQTSFSNGATRIFGLVMNELRTAAWVAIPVAVLMFLIAGREKRNGTVALDMGAAASVVYALAGAPYRMLGLNGAHGDRWLAAAKGLEIAAFVVTGAFTLYASLAWRGGWRRALRPSGKWPGLLLSSVLAFVLLLNVRYIGSHLATLRPLGLGDESPGFSLPRVGKPEEHVALAAMRGKVVVLDFWATWCSPCLALLPTLHALAADYAGKGVVFIGVNVDGGDPTDESVRVFLADHPAGYPSVVDDGRVSGRYGVQSIPHLVVIDRDGRISKVLSGLVTRGALEQAIQGAL